MSNLGISAMVAQLTPASVQRRLLRGIWSLSERELLMRLGTWWLDPLFLASPLHGATPWLEFLQLAQFYPPLHTPPPCR